MDRRNFLRLMVGGVAASAAVRRFPFRVYSFPNEIVAPEFVEYFYLDSSAASFAIRAEIPAWGFRKVWISKQVLEQMYPRPGSIIPDVAVFESGESMSVFEERGLIQFSP